MPVQRNHARRATSIAALEGRAPPPVDAPIPPSHGRGRPCPRAFVDGRGRPSLHALALFCSLAIGCAGGLTRVAPGNHPPKARQGRKAGETFNEQRDRSEFEAARFAWRQNDVEGCRELLEKLLKRNPGHREAGLLLAELLLVEQHPDLARRQLQRSLSHHPGDAETLYAMGLLLDAEDKPAEAQAYFAQASQAAPDNQEYRLSYQAAVERLHPSSEGESIAAEESALPAAAEPAPHTVAAEPETLQASLQQTGAERASFAPSASESWLEQVDAALSAGQSESAHALVQKARRDAPSDERVPLSAAVLAIKRDELELAVEIAQDGITSFPESAGLYRTLGAAQYRLGEFKSAKQSLQQAVALDKSHPLSYFLLGSALTKLGQSEAAEAYFRQAQQLDPRYAARR